MNETVRHISEWHEDHGSVLWWHKGEPPYVGSPLDLGREVLVTLTLFRENHEHRHNVGGWPGYHEWWTPLPPAPKLPKRPKFRLNLKPPTAPQPGADR